MSFDESERSFGGAAFTTRNCECHKKHEVLDAEFIDMIYIEIKDRHGG